MSKGLVICILAAGKGTRMNSDIPKVLHDVNGKSMIQRIIDTAIELSPLKIITIVGYKKELIIKDLELYEIDFAIQKDQNGTGHAVEQCREKIKDIDGNMLILSGDVPLISKNTLKSLIKYHINNKSKASLISAILDNPYGYGRIKWDENKNFECIIEHKDASESELTINEINAGIYIFDIKTLFKNLLLINNNNNQQEYYIGDVLKFIKKKEISVIQTSNPREIIGVNSIDQLHEINK